MRTFFRIILPLTAVFTLIGWNSSASTGRELTLLRDDWRFQFGENTNARSVTFADSAWQKISLPHNWGWEQAQQGKNYQRGPGWYRRTVNIGQPKPGRRYFLKFEAAGSVADVYLNDQALGQHRGAFGAFCYEITKTLSPTGTNTLAVRVSNAPEPDLAPLSGDFPVYGGLYRSVQLIETDETCFTLTDHGSPGVAWRQTEVSKTRAILDVTTQISNGAIRKESLVLVARVVDAAGRTITTTETPITLQPAVTEPFTTRVTIDQPHLWQGRHDPYLYRAIVALRGKDGVEQDAVEQPLGLRSYFVDPDKGFFLNGAPYHLHGVNKHQDRPGKGWAVTEADLEEDLKLILELGCTVVRCAHYQHSDYFYSLCDQAGLLVWAEIPQVDRVGKLPEFADTSRNQLLDLIRQNLNHPSIFVWSLFNELRPNNPDPHRLLQDLKVVAHGEDPSRPTIAATCTTGWPQMNKIPDLLGWNVYYGWYGDWGPLEDYDPMRAGYRLSSRSGGYSVSEYGAGANVAQHEQNPKKPKNDGPWHPEEYQSHLHEEAWHQLQAAPYIWGTFVWCMFDFTSYWRNEGGFRGLNDKGLVTADRQTRKDAFYFYKANWSDEPTLYITSRRHTERTNAVTDVKIYSNAGTVELLLNGRSVGHTNAWRDHTFVWKDIRLTPGENRIEAQAVTPGPTLVDRCLWKLQ